MNKWSLIGKSLLITLVLLVVRLAVDTARYDLLSVTNLVTAFIGGAIFTVAIIFTGTLVDYKESEKIPGELAGSLLTLYQDCRLVRPEGNPVAVHLREHVDALYRAATEFFTSNRHRMEIVRPVIAEINRDLYALADQNIPPQFLVKLRTELATIDRLLTRVRTISETSFIPAAYAIAELAVAGVVLILFFVKLDPYYEGLVIFSAITMLLVSLLLLIRDMDNPFEYDQGTNADVDLAPLLELEPYFREHP